MNYKPYKELMYDIAKNGIYAPTRQKESTGTRYLLNQTLKFNDLMQGEPIFTGRKLFPNKAFAELRWWLMGCPTDLKILHEHNIHWWDSYKPLGKVYGSHFYHYQQFDKFLKDLASNPFSRRHYLSFWDYTSTKGLSLPSCILGFQIIVDSYYEATMIVNQRSADVLIGLPYDILQMQLLFHLICQNVGIKPKELIFNIMHAHIYLEQIKFVHKLYDSESHPHYIVIDNEFNNNDIWLKNAHKPIDIPQDLFDFSSYEDLDLEIMKIPVFL